MAQKKEEDVRIDARLEHMFNYMFKSYKLKSEKWNKMVDNEDFKNMLLHFFDKVDVDCLTITITPAGALVPSYNFPSNPKGKTTYFIRRFKEPITYDNVYYMLICGDISAHPLEEFSSLIEQAWLPFLSNPNNHKGWPSVISEDVMKHTQDLKSLVDVARGKSRGEILLPMPIGVDRVHEAEKEIIESAGDNVDMYLKNSIEGMIIRWVLQINVALKEDPNHIYDNKHKPTPTTEIDFWKNRLKIMESIYSQLCDPRVKKMSSILELTESVYFGSFKSIFANVVAALAEARDVSLFLKPLQKWVQAIESVEFDEVDELLEPLLVTICLIWGNSRYFCNSSRLLNLFKQIVNLLISCANKYLDPSSLFQGEVYESLKQIQKVIYSLNLFKKKYFEYRDKISTYFKPGVQVMEWNFHPEIIFSEQNDFIDRIKLLEELFVSADDYLKLEKVEIGGLMGKMLSARVTEIEHDFGEAFAPFQNMTYDPLDTKDDTFVKDYEIFKQTNNDLDSKLASVFSNAFEDCSNLSSIFKLVYIFTPFLERPIIRDLLMPKMSIIFDLYEKEIGVIKEIFDEHVLYYMLRGYMILDPYNPPTAGAVLWVQKLQKRLNEPAENLANLEFDIISNPHAFHVLDKKNEMIDLLQAFQLHVFSEWSTKVPSVIRKNLKMPLLLRNEETMLIRLNFSPEFHSVLREVRYLKLAEITNIPHQAIELSQRENEIRNSIHHLHRLIY